MPGVLKATRFGYNFTVGEHDSGVLVEVRCEEQNH